MEAWLPLLFWVVVPLVFITVFGGIGLVLQHRHFSSLERREDALRDLVAINFDAGGETATASRFVRGSCVVAPDYARSFFAWLKGIFGGQLGSLQPVLERGRREALLRMKEEAHAHGHDAILNVRLETSRIASKRSDGKGTSGVELVAYGTAITRARSEP